MMAIFQEILIRFPELAVHPESPAARLWSGDQQRPATSGMYFDRVSVRSRSEADGPCRQELTFRWRYIGIDAVQHQRDEPPGVVVEVAMVVRREPVVKPDRKEPEIQNPPSHVGAFGPAKFLAPDQSNLHSTRGWD